MTTNGTARIYRPAAMGYGCDAFNPNPRYGLDPDAPRLLRCTCQAEALIVIQEPAFVMAVKRCHYHAHKTRQEAAADGNKILSDEPVLIWSH